MLLLRLRYCLLSRNSLCKALHKLFKEDYCRVRTGNVAENLNTIRKIALNTIKMDTTVKQVLRIKERCADGMITCSISFKKHESVKTILVLLSSGHLNRILYVKILG